MFIDDVTLICDIILSPWLGRDEVSNISLIATIRSVESPRRDIWTVFDGMSATLAMFVDDRFSVLMVLNHQESMPYQRKAWYGQIKYTTQHVLITNTVLDLLTFIAVYSKWRPEQTEFQKPFLVISMMFVSWNFLI